MNVATAFREAFDGRTVLVTGHTGFKGAWLTHWLSLAGARVIGYALEPYTPRDGYAVSRIHELMEASIIADVRDPDALTRTVEHHQPDVVFHLAAQPLVRLSYDIPAETYDINVVGTANLLTALAENPPAATLVITSDKCYRNDGRTTPYAENDALGGHDPYSSSKACQELVTQAYRDSFFTPAGAADALKTVRAGNVIGGGDWAADRIVPDCIRALGAGAAVRVRNKDAVRPWQHVLEPLGGYLLLAARMLEGSSRRDLAPHTAFNFGPDPSSNIPVGDLVDSVVRAWGSGSWEYVPEPGAVHEAALLTLDASLAASEMGWSPVLDVGEAVTWTVEWYRTLATGGDTREHAERAIRFYEERASQTWTSFSADEREGSS